MYNNECKENEIFVGNVPTDAKLFLNGIKYRRGEQAYFLDGTKIHKNYMRPLFIDKTDFEKYNKIKQDSCK